MAKTGSMQGKEFLPDYGEGAPGGSIPGHQDPAFALIGAERAEIPVLIAAPHAGRSYPPALLANLRHSEKAQINLEDRHVDRIARVMAQDTGAALLVANAPRAMIDLNRADDDVDWSMVAGPGARTERMNAIGKRARSGLGLVPRRVAGVGELWREPMSQLALQQRIDGIHRPYHAALSGTLDALRDRFGAALLIDVHSMPPLRRNHASDRHIELVIGDRFGASCDAGIVSKAIRFFDERGRGAALNRPYAGGYVLDRHAQPKRAIHGIQLEICRSTYLDARFDRPSPRLPAVSKLLSEFTSLMANEIGRNTAWRVAAE